MKYTLIILCSLLNLCIAYAQQQLYYPICKDSLWGYMNEQGAVVIKPEYSAVGFVSSDTLLVCRNWEWGMVNKQGEWMIKPRFKELYPFHSGLAKMELNDLYGYVSPTDSIVIQPVYTSVTNFYNARSVVMLEKRNRHIYYLLDQTGKRKKVLKTGPIGERTVWNFEISEGIFTIEKVKRSRRRSIRYYDTEGRLLFTKTQPAFLKEGRFCIFTNKKVSFWDAAGNIIIKKQFDNAKDYRDSFAAVCSGEKWGFIDYHGNQKIPYMYDYAYSFSKGLALVRLNEKWFFIDKKGNTIISIDSLKPIYPLKFKKAWRNGTRYESSFIGNLALVYINNKLTYIDRAGKIVWQE